MLPMEKSVTFTGAWDYTDRFVIFDSSILITIISCDYLNLSLANEHVVDITIPTQVIEYNQNFLQVD